MMMTRHGQVLRSLVEERRSELEVALAEIQEKRESIPRGEAIEAALNTLDALLPENVDDLPNVVAAQLTQWLEANKYLTENADSHSHGHAHEHTAQDPV